MVSIQIIEAFLQIVTQDSWDSHMARPRNQTGSVSSSSQPVGRNPFWGSHILHIKYLNYYS